MGSHTYNSRKQAGICVLCGLTPSTTDRVHCTACLDIEKARSKIKYAKYTTVHSTRKLGNCTSCGGFNVEFGGRKDSISGIRSECIKCKNKKSSIYHLMIKIAAFDAYGGCACVGCAISNIDVLTIDHINGGGTKHRKEIRGSIYTWLKKNNYPQGFRVLCMNCQFIAKLSKPLPNEVLRCA